jgi:hypothetical protein
MTVGAGPLTLIRQVGRRVMPKYVIERDIPATGISRVRTVIDPTTSEGRGSGR